MIPPVPAPLSDDRRITEPVPPEAPAFTLPATVMRPLPVTGAGVVVSWNVLVEPADDAFNVTLPVFAKYASVPAATVNATPLAPVCVLTGAAESPTAPLVVIFTRVAEIAVAPVSNATLVALGAVRLHVFAGAAPAPVPAAFTVGPESFNVIWPEVVSVTYTDAVPVVPAVNSEALVKIGFAIVPTEPFVAAITSA